MWGSPVRPPLKPMQKPCIKNLELWILNINVIYWRSVVLRQTTFRRSCSQVCQRTLRLQVRVNAECFKAAVMAVSVRTSFIKPQKNKQTRTYLFFHYVWSSDRFGFPWIAHFQYPDNWKWRTVESKKKKLEITNWTLSAKSSGWELKQNTENHHFNANRTGRPRSWVAQLTLAAHFNILLFSSFLCLVHGS